MEQQKEYFAFISYQRRDEKWADGLRKKLEHYRLPSSVRKQNPSLPKDIRPIFRDALELAGGVLADEIASALQQSKYLIVICSPNSAQSPWVNKEIQTFIDFGRVERIIPFIIDGSPFSDDPATECFPPALRSLRGERELLGININELGRDAAAVKVVARMFGLKFDVLWQRYEREKRRKRWMITGGILLLAIAALILASVFFNLNKQLQNTIGDRDRALTQVRQDSAIMVNHLRRIMQDSLTLAQQNDSIQKQYAFIEKQKDEIATERDNVKSANYAMQLNLSRVLAEKANQLTEEGDSYLARLIALQALPPNTPYTFDAEFALRKACENKTAILNGHNSSVYYAALSTDGNRIVSASRDNTVRIWDANTGKMLQKLEGHTAQVNSASFSCDGKYIVSASDDKTVRIWDAQTGKELKKLEGHTGWVTSAAFSPDGNRIVSSSSDKTIRIWNARTGDVIKAIKFSHVPTSALFDQDGSRICAISNGDVYCLNAQTGNTQLIQKGYGTFASFSPDGKRIVTSLWSNTISILDVQTRQELQTLKGHMERIMSASFSPDGKYIVSASKDKTIRIWDVQTGVNLQTLEGDTQSVLFASFSSDGMRILSASADNTLRIWNTQTTQPFHTLIGHNSTVWGVSCSPNSKLVASSSYDKTVKIWDVQTGDCMQTLKGHSFVVGCASFSPDGKRIVSASYDKTVRFWDVQTGESLGSLERPNWIRFVFFSPDGERVVFSDDDTVRIWNPKTGIFRKFEGHSGVVTSASFSPDGKFLVSSSGDKTLRIWNVQTGKTVHTLRGHTDWVTSAAFSPDGNRIVSSSSDKTIRIWNARTGDRLLTIKSHNEKVTSASFSPDGKWVITSSLDSTIRIRDAFSGSQLQMLKGHSDGVSSASFTPDGRYIVSSSFDGTVRIWDFPPLQELIDQTREQFKDRPLTDEEKRKYYLE